MKCKLFKNYSRRLRINLLEFKRHSFILILLLHKQLLKAGKKKIYEKHYMEIKGKRSLVICESFGNREFEHRYLSVYIIKMQSM